MIREAPKSHILIASLSIATLVLSGCASPGYQRVCDWCDDASQAQLTKDVAECNSMATSQVPDRSERRKTGRIVTSHGSTSCTTNKKGHMTCSTGSSYTYPEEETVDITDYGARKKLFTECTDAKAQNYRPKVASTKANSSQASMPKEENYNWDLKTPPEKIEFTWMKGSTASDGKTLYISMNRNSIQVNENRRVFWALQDHENKGSPKIRSMLMQIELDCLAHKMRPLVGYAFPEPMGTGELIGRMRIPSDSSEGAWKNVSPSESHVSKICATR